MYFCKNFGVVKKKSLLFLCLMVALITMKNGNLLAQTSGSGTSVFHFMELPVSARLNALGGSNVAIDNGDISMSVANPALLSQKTHNMCQLNYCRYTSWVNMGSALFGHNFSRSKLEQPTKHDSLFSRPNYFAVSFQFVSYGKMTYTDENGIKGGDFTATDMVISATYARPLSRLFTVGVALKPIYSVYESYHSFALGADIGGHYHTHDGTFQLGLTLRNIGWQLKGFYSQEGGQHTEKLPLNLELGSAYKVDKAPFRIGMTLHNLQRWHLGYGVDANEASIEWYDMLFRHTIFYVDVVPQSDKFYLTLSYNHRRNRELRLASARSLAGIAMGGGMRIKQFGVDFAVSQLNKRNISFHLGLSMNINDLLK